MPCHRPQCTDWARAYRAPGGQVATCRWPQAECKQERLLGGLAVVLSTSVMSPPENHGCILTWPHCPRCITLSSFLATILPFQHY